MDKEYYSRGIVKVTSTLADFGSTSYPIANIGAVSVGKSHEGILGTVVTLVIVGLIALAFGGFGVLVGIALIGGGIYFAIQGGTTTYNLEIRTSSGNTQAYSSTDESEIGNVRSAILTAIAERG